MHRLNEVVFLLLLFISQYQAQDPTTPGDWNGDSNLCTVNPTTTPSSLPAPPIPRFPNQAEFALERVEVKHIQNITLPSEITTLEYLYDYNANQLIIVKNRNGIIDVEYFYYGIMKKSTYYGGDFCVVTNIPTGNDMDGASPIQLPDGTWHIRPLNEFLLFSSDNPNRRVTPIYLGTDTVRGIPVHKWQSCYIDRAQYRTVRRIWTFAQEGFTMPGVVNNLFSVPVQALISASVVFPNGTQLAEFDEEFNIYTFRPGIMESNDALSPPKGVFCASGPGQNLISLKDAGVSWPNHFSVRVDTSTSRSSRWERFHLRYDQGREQTSKRLRYDYMPPGSEDFITVIHDYTDNITYIIDRQVGTCNINRGVEIPAVSSLRDPIRFFIKHEAHFIFNPPEKAWEFNGFRSCRGKAIKCAILTTSVDNFPAIVDPDIGMGTGETWAATNMEYGWSVRAPFSTATSDQPKQFDYPVSLYLKMYRFRDPSNPSPLNLVTEDIEYEFYEMSHESKPSDFDISTCYRSLDLPYLHLGFVLKPSNNNPVDSKYLNRRALELNLRSTLANKMQIKWTRISNVELDHIRFDNSIYVLFTLLGPVPIPNNDESSVETAKVALETAINAGQFTFDITLLDNVQSQIELKAQPNSLKVSQQFMSIHASWVYANVSNCNVSNCEVPNVNNSNNNGQRLKQEKYTAGAKAGGIIGGLIVGIVLGFVVLVLNRFLNKISTPTNSPTISSDMKNIIIRDGNSAPPSNAQNLQNSADTFDT
ncbi:unnamed protein product [Rotaria sordida]|uniref:Uncharacterized protein n=1 Tax=Rotaria sordida TaxID=392033 RepID=A0A814U4C7_9BILA|nr:unnamed protein product [Rotaria sordida]CAF1167010.1 unnamed protein product [Rotaria sordida]CAF1185194.1 unnamed protein product [Rotaria sordida]CAF1448058.1 unnamed protein product [Rotaria sordida]CAF4013496.1 unnamed protein product [Rotaria sordida]